MRKPDVAFDRILAVVSFIVLIACGILAPRQVAAAPAPREEPRECKELGPSSPRCTLARDKQTRDRLTPRACTKYGAESPQCDRALKKQRAKPGTATPK